MNTTYLKLTDKGKWVLHRVRNLLKEGLSIDAAWELADSEADQLFGAGDANDG